MSVLCDLTAAGIIERDKNNDVLWTWAYPAITPEQREFLISKSCLGTDNPLPVNFVYGQWKETWYYISVIDVDDGNTVLPQLTQFAMVLLCKDFNPEKYSVLCKLFGGQYQQTGSAAAMLERYLSVLTRGTCNSDENGKFSVNDYGAKEAYAKSQIKEIIQTFGVETILMSIPAFAWHRQNWNILHPYVQLTEEEIENLQTHSHYVAGFTEAAIEGRDELYDIFVNVPNSQIVIASHAKDSLSMGKLHKDIALLMVAKAEDDSLSDIDVITEIATKTQELLNNLKSLATLDEESGKPSLTLETLKERKMPPATENFLFSLAASEGFVKL